MAVYYHNLGRTDDPQQGLQVYKDEQTQEGGYLYFPKRPGDPVDTYSWGRCTGAFQQARLLNDKQFVRISRCRVRKLLRQHNIDAEVY